VRPGLTFHPRFAVAAIDGEGACLLSERTEIALEGPVFAAIAGAIDGVRDADAVVDALTDFPPAHVYHALLELEERGYVTTASSSTGPLQAPEPRPPVTPPPRTLSIHPMAVGTVQLTDVMAALEHRGVVRATDGPRVVLTDDYLNPALGKLNRQAVESGAAWLLAKPVGELVWVGPVLGLADGPCWACLHHRLQRHRPLFEFLCRRVESQVPQVPMHTTTASLRCAAEEVLRWLAAWHARKDLAALAHRLVVIDTTTGTVQSHQAPSRPQCPVCSGRAAERVGELVSPVTGIVGTLEPLAGESSSVHVWVARPSPFADAETLAGLQAQRRHVNLGRGASAAEARASALGEAIERYSGVFQGTEPNIRASRCELGQRAIHPNHCMLFSDAQYQAGRLGGDASVPLPFDEEASLDWTPVQSWPQGEPRYVLTASLYYAYPADPATDFCRADSNGCASGRTREQAVLNGLLEVIERDATAIWWYNRLLQPEAPLAAVDDPVIDGLRREYEREGRRFWVLDLASDLGIPTYAAVTGRVAPPHEFLFGFGCNPVAAIALRRAVTEMHQVVAALAAVRDRSTLAPGLKTWLERPPPDLTYLHPGGEGSWSPSPAARHLDVADALGASLRPLLDRSLAVLVADLTRPDVGVPTVKVIVPGLRPSRPRFAPGRLYDVPVSMGRRRHRCSEADLNPTPFSL
jgi:ribosomal protein S12 methylthiotransferase accessory factor